MKVVLDTNILISAIFWRGNPYKVLHAGLDQKYLLTLSTEILNELEEKLRLKFVIPEEIIEEHIEILTEYAEIIQPVVKFDVIKEDPDDNMILECAISCKADYIVSGDEHLLKLKKFKGTKIVTPKEFLDLV